MRNCLTYAISMYFKQGGYIHMRRSLIAQLHNVGKWHVFNLVPHFLHESKEGVVTQLIRTPEENAAAIKAGPWRDWVWLWHFEGRIVTGDEAYLGSEVK